MESVSPEQSGVLLATVLQVCSFTVYSLCPLTEMMKKLVTAGGGLAESYNPIQLKSEATNIQLSQSASVDLLTSGSVGPPGAAVFLGYAVKPKRGKGMRNQRFTSTQLAFLQWGYSLGVKDKNQKMVANVAAEVMPTVGTMAGEVKFTPSIGKLDPYMKANNDGKPTFNQRSECRTCWMFGA